MSPRAWRALLIIGIALIILVGAFGVILYRTKEIAASSYEVQSARWWALAAGGYGNFADQIVSLKPDPSSASDVCHVTRVQLRSLNSISLAGQIPQEYRAFHSSFIDAMSTNKLYYKQILRLCSEGATTNSTVLSSLFTLGKDVEDRYREAHNLMPGIGSRIDPGTYSEVNQRLARIFQPSRRAEAPKIGIVKVPQVIEVPVHQYSQDLPPAVGRIIIVDTPKGGPLNFRVAPSLSADRVQGREVLAHGERVLVLGRDGDWLYVSTEDGYTGYISWWYEGDAYVRPQ